MTPMLDFLGVTNPFNGTLQSVLQRVPSSNELPLVPDSTPANVTESFHDVTTQTAFTLVDTVRGGLKMDLSDLTRPNATPSEYNWKFVNDRLQYYANLGQQVKERVGFGNTTSGNFDYDVYTMYPNVSANATIAPGATTTVGGNSTAEYTSFNIHPIITEFLLGMGLSAYPNYPASGENEVVLSYYVFAELWNPFPVNLKYHPRMTTQSVPFLKPDPDTQCIQLTVSGLPSVRVSGSGSTVQKNLPTLVTHLDVYNPQLDDDNQPAVLRAGKVYWCGWPESGNGTLDPMGNNDGPGVWAVDVGIEVPGSSSTTYTVLFGAANVSLTFAQENLGQSNAAPQPFETVHLNGFSSQTVTYTPNVNGFVRAFGTAAASNSRAAINDNQTTYSYYFRLNDDLTPGTTAWSDLLSNYGPLATNLSINVTGADTITGNNADFATFANPTQVDRNNLFTFSDYFTAPEENDSSASVQGAWTDRYAFNYDIPTQDLISVGQLSHLVFNNYLSTNGTTSSQPLALGNEWGGEVNECFDRYFFSGLSAYSGSGNSTWDRISPLPNTYLSYYASTIANATTTTANLASANSSANLLLQNGFNINSTSTNAWATILSGGNLSGGNQSGNQSGNLTPWNYQISQPDQNFAQSNISVRNTFFNFSFSADRLLRPISVTTATGGNIDAVVYTGPTPMSNLTERTLLTQDTYYPDNPAITPKPVLLPALRDGVRQLTDDEIQQLAQNITQQIKGRGAPFTSLQGFVNSGIVKNAIANVTTINAPDPNDANNTIVPYSPAYLSQATVLGYLSPRLSARSDTFVIRTYGAVVNPFGGPPITAYCQARVQRVPDVLFTGLTGNSTANTTLTTTRQFKIIAFQWLSPGDI
jgi:hypothetical protein